jgi:hypothetical protein
MVTLLQVTWSTGKRERCDARCHDATHQACTCCCRGLYHGKQEGSLGFNAAVLEHQTQLLAELAFLEEAGTLWIDACRGRPDEPLQRRPKGKVRAYQEPLFAPDDLTGRRRRGVRVG